MKGDMLLQMTETKIQTDTIQKTIFSTIEIPAIRMIQAFFELQGNRYKLKYQKVQTEDGELYQGILFWKNVIGFSFIRKDDSKVFFDSDFIDKNVQTLIVETIAHKEKRLRTKNNHN